MVIIILCCLEDRAVEVLCGFSSRMKQIELQGGSIFKRWRFERQSSELRERVSHGLIIPSGNGAAGTSVALTGT